MPEKRGFISSYLKGLKDSFSSGQSDPQWSDVDTKERMSARDTSRSHDLR